MKSFKHIALTALLTAGSFGAVLYTSCNKDACKDVVCQNGGTCADGKCTCATGYTGTNCETRAIIGSWKGSDACTVTGTVNNITITVDNSSANANSVIIKNPGGFGAAVTITGTISTDGKTVTYTNQTVNSSTTVTGTITLTSNTAFTHSYTATDASGPETCSGNYTKQ